MVFFLHIVSIFFTALNGDADCVHCGGNSKIKFGMYVSKIYFWTEFDIVIRKILKFNIII